MLTTQGLTFAEELNGDGLDLTAIIINNVIEHGQKYIQRNRNFKIFILPQIQMDGNFITGFKIELRFTF